MKYFLQDLKSILRPLWFILILQLFILFTFIHVPQGVDVLYCVIEDFSTLLKFSQNHFLVKAKVLPFISILVALFYWSISSEFCARLILYISDYSSESISKERKRRRYYMSKYIPMMFFYFPTLMLIIAFIHSFIIKVNMTWSENEDFNLIALILILLGLFFLLRILHNVRYGKWKSKFKKPILGYVDVMNLVGLSAVYDHYDKRSNVVIKKYKPVYLMYYRLLFIAIFSILLFILLPSNQLEQIGATAFICMGFGSWIVVLFILEWVAKKGLLGIQLPFKTILLIYISFISYINNDHPIRLLKIEQEKKARPNLETYFNQWISARPQVIEPDSVIHPIFIAVEGGALRTGCFSAMFLAHLIDTLPQFKDRIFCYSSVSGGSVGVGVINSLIAQKDSSKSFTKHVRTFFEYDFLSPVTSKLVFGEPLNLFTPKSLSAADRAIALENGFESAWKNLSFQTSNTWKEGYSNFYQIHPTLPLQFINTTEVELGRRAIISPVELNYINFYNYTDVLAELKSSEDIPYSTAVSLSARFPLVSPAGFYKNENLKEGKHFVDGGYYENKGDITLLEVMKAIKSFKTVYKIEPIVIQLSFNEPDSSIAKSISFGNEIQEIIRAMYNTRIARTVSANQELRSFINETCGNDSYLEFYLKGNSNSVPMNWVLSNNALDNIEKECKNLINKKTIEHLQRNCTQKNTK